jgi:hypothetical protein
MPARNDDVAVHNQDYERAGHRHGAARQKDRGQNPRASVRRHAEAFSDREGDVRD